MEINSVPLATNDVTPRVVPRNEVQPPPPPQQEPRQSPPAADPNRRVGSLVDTQA